MNPHQKKRELSLCEELLVIYIVQVLGFDQDLIRSGMVEDLVLQHGSAIKLETLKLQFLLNREQEQRLQDILAERCTLALSEQQAAETVIIHRKAA